jgi:hypothetical protein
MGFLSNLFGDPPQPPNPIVTAQAQTASNIGTGIVGNYLNAVNQVTPTGNLTYNINPYGYNYQDPLGGSYNIPQTTVTQTLPPEAQAALEAQQRTQRILAQMGEAQSTKLGGILGTNFQDIYNQAPGAAPMAWLYDNPQAQLGFADVGGQQRSLGDAGAITRDYGPADNFSADRSRVEESLFKRMDPQLQQDRDRLRQQLADQGIKYGSPAYDQAMAQADRQTTDARLAVTAAGGAEQQRMADMAAKRAGFQNEAQMQAYQQMLQSGNFANEAQKNAFTQEASRAQFTNAARAQYFAQDKAMFDAANADRDRYLREQYALRSQPINEISALQSGSQVAQPNWASTAQQNVANTDVAGIINSNFNQSLDVYKQNSSNLNNIIGGMFGLASAGVKASDRRVKKNVARVGSVYAAKRHDAPKKLPIYSYEYKDGHEDGGARRHVGPMAQDVERIDPQAVTTRDGVKHIKTRRVLGDILRVA